jgi:hypothetical protein
VENARGFGQQWNIAHPSNVSQARLRATEGEPLIEQADAIAPFFDVFAAFQSPVTTGADFGAGYPVEHRTTQEMIARPFAADELPAQFNDFWQIKVIPLYLAIIWLLRADALETRIETASNMDNDRLPVAGQKVPRVAVELSVTQDKSYLIILSKLDLLDPREIIVHLPDQRHGFLVFEEGIGAL